MRRLGTLLAAIALGCSSSPAADLHLTLDPNLNTTAEMLAKIDKIVIVVDSEPGLYAPGMERVVGPTQIKNADGDDDLELVITAPVPKDHLPFVRLERGRLPNRPLSFRIFGLSADPTSTTYVARGEISGIDLTAPVAEVNIPFNLRPEERSPRVDQVLPADGAMVNGCRVNPLVLLFSRPMNRASLTAPGVVAITPDPGPISVFLDDSGLVANVVASGLQGAGATLTYHVHVGPEALDVAGDPLHQIASMNGAQPFEADFNLSCGPPPVNPQIACAAGLLCDFQYKCVDNACQPPTCPTPCTQTQLCDPKRGVCVDDCRNKLDGFDLCPPPETCNVDGLCR